MSSLPHSFAAPVLKVENVSLTLGGNQILRDVNLEIRDVRRPDAVAGQVVALLGPSGIGKTCLFRILAGLNPPDSGSVLLGEKGIPVRRGMVGVVAQTYPLFNHRRALGNLVLAARMGGRSGSVAKEAAMKYLQRFGLEDRGHLYPVQLSGGQRQRVAIAQQFLCSEHFLLMDEPFSGLDPLAIETLIQFITEVANADELNTIIVVTHDIEAAIEVADTLWLLGRDRDAAGKIIPGAKVQQSYDLLARGLAWREGVIETPEFQVLYREIREWFPRL